MLHEAPQLSPKGAVAGVDEPLLFVLSHRQRLPLLPQSCAVPLPPARAGRRRQQHVAAPAARKQQAQGRVQQRCGVAQPRQRRPARGSVVTHRRRQSRRLALCISTGTAGQAGATPPHRRWRAATPAGWARALEQRAPQAKTWLAGCSACRGPPKCRRRYALRGAFATASAQQLRARAAAAGRSERQRSATALPRARVQRAVSSFGGALRSTKTEGATWRTAQCGTMTTAADARAQERPRLTTFPLPQPALSVVHSLLASCLEPSYRCGARARHAARRCARPRLHCECAAQLACCERGDALHAAAGDRVAWWRPAWCSRAAMGVRIAAVVQQRRPASRRGRGARSAGERARRRQGKGAVGGGAAEHREGLHRA